MPVVETTKLEQITSIVEREYDRLAAGRKGYQLGGFQRGAFQLLRWVTYSIPIALAFLVVGFTWLGWGGSLQAVVLFAWLVLAPILLVPLILLNLPLLVVAWRQRRPIVKRDLVELGLPSWLRKARWLVLGLTVVAAVLAFTVEAFGWGGFVLYLGVVVLPFSMLMLQSFLRLVDRNLELLRSVSEVRGLLREKLEAARREEEASVDLPHEVAVGLSASLDSSLRNERLRILDEDLRQPSTAYSVRQSGAFRKGLQALQPAARLELLDRVQQLGEQRQPEGALHDASTDRWIWPLPGEGLELVYEVADGQSQVLIHELRPPRAASSDSDGAG